LLVLILPFAIRVRNLANLIPIEEEHLGDPLVGIDLGGQRCRIGNFESHKTFPFRLKGCHIDNNPAACVRAFAHANGKDGTGDAEIFDRARERKGIRRDDADIPFKVRSLIGHQISLDQQLR